MRIILIFLFLFILQNSKAQESFRSFHEVNPALETFATNNLAYRNILNEDALYNYFHIHSNKIHRQINLGLDIQTKNFDLNNESQIKALFKANYQFRITRGLSLYGGAGIGINHSKVENNGFLIPGISVVARKFSIGYNSLVQNLGTKANLQHSIQAGYTFKIFQGRKVNSIVNKMNGNKYFSKNYDLHFSYLNYLNPNLSANHFLVTKIKSEHLSFLIGCNNSDTQNYYPMFGFGLIFNNLHMNFQTVFNRDDIKEMQISISYHIQRLMKRNGRFVGVSMPYF